MSADDTIPDLNPDDAERLIVALEDARSWAKHPTDAELDKRVHVISQILRGERVTTANLNMLIGWYACNMPSKKQYLLSNVRLLQRVIDEHNLPQEWLGRVINQISRYAKDRHEHHELEHEFMDPMEAITDLLNGVHHTLNGQHEHRTDLAFHAIYRPAAVSTRDLMDYYRHYESHKHFWEKLVSENNQTTKSESTHVPRELVVQAQDALDHCMQEKLKVSRVISKAIFRPGEVSPQELKMFLTDYEKNMENLHKASTREGFPSTYVIRSKKAIADLVEYHGLEIPESSRKALNIRRPKKPVEQEKVQKFAQALTEEMDKVNGHYDMRARFRIFAGLLKDPESVSKHDIALINQYCTRTLREAPREVREAFSNREILTRVATRANLGLKYVTHAFVMLEERGKELKAEVVLTMPAGMWPESKPVHGPHSAKHRHDSEQQKASGPQHT